MQAELGELVVDCNGIEIYENDFEFAISEACKKENIDDLRAAKQGPWQAVMRDVGKTIFSNNNIINTEFESNETFTINKQICLILIGELSIMSIGMILLKALQQANDKKEYK